MFDIGIVAQFNSFVTKSCLTLCYNIKKMKKGGSDMTEQLIKDLKEIQKRLVNKDMAGEEWEEKMEAVNKLEDVVSYLKDALGKGIEF